MDFVTTAVGEAKTSHQDTAGTCSTSRKTSSWTMNHLFPSVRTLIPFKPGVICTLHIPFWFTRWGPKCFLPSTALVFSAQHLHPSFHAGTLPAKLLPQELPSEHHNGNFCWYLQWCNEPNISPPECHWLRWNYCFLKVQFICSAHCLEILKLRAQKAVWWISSSYLGNKTILGMIKRILHFKDYKTSWFRVTSDFTTITRLLVPLRPRMLGTRHQMRQP